MPDYGYGPLDRLLHRLALKYPAVAEASFDFDQRGIAADRADTAASRHVFIAGLARAGTTALLQRLHAADVFRSLTYRDMPFVLAPNLWRRLSAASRRENALSERAHGDSVLVNADSPESLDEVFWRVFAGDAYIRDDHLCPHDPPADVVCKYVDYVGAVLAAAAVPRHRYLCKNNNNILRLRAIGAAFPNALILVPFRDPMQHACSLLRQHERFTELQRETSFVEDYMRWLGHHEFGLDHRPFMVGGFEPERYPRETLDYWLLLWCEVYEWLLATRPGSAVLLCYEELCANEEVWKRVAAIAHVDGERAAGPEFRRSRDVSAAGAQPALAERAAYIYRELTEAARRSLETRVSG